MASGNESVVAMAPETTWGERVTSNPELTYLACQVDPQFTRESLRAPIVFGARSVQKGQLGRPQARVRMTGIQGYPDIVGLLLKAAIGQRWAAADRAARRFDQALAAVTTWASAIAFEVGDYVLHSSMYYRCITAHTSASGNVANGAPNQSNAVNWSAALSTTGSDPDIELEDAPAAWASATEYYVGSKVTQSGSYYIANRDHTAVAGNMADGAPGQSNATAWDDYNLGVQGANIHRFIPAYERVAATNALDPYTIYIRQGSGANSLLRAFTGSQLSSLTFRQPRDGVLTIDAEWICRGVERAPQASSAVAPAFSGVTLAPSYSDEDALLYRDVCIQRAGADFEDAQELTVTINNNLEAEYGFICDRSDADNAIGIGFGTLNLGVDMRLNYIEDARLTYTEDFEDGVAQEWSFTWDNGERDMDQRLLEIKLPSLLLDNWGFPIDGPGLITVRTSGVGELDSSAEADDSSPGVDATDGYDIQITVRNGEDDYSA